MVELVAPLLPSRLRSRLSRNPVSGWISRPEILGLKGASWSLAALVLTLSPVHARARFGPRGFGVVSHPGPEDARGEHSARSSAGVVLAQGARTGSRAGARGTWVRSQVRTNGLCGAPAACAEHGQIAELALETRTRTGTHTPPAGPPSRALATCVRAGLVPAWPPPGALGAGGRVRSRAERGASGVTGPLLSPRSPVLGRGGRESPVLRPGAWRGVAECARRGPGRTPSFPCERLPEGTRSQGAFGPPALTWHF